MQAFPCKVYNMNTVSKEVELPGGFFLGAGAVSCKTTGMNGEVCIAALKQAALSFSTLKCSDLVKLNEIKIVKK